MKENTRLLHGIKAMLQDISLYIRDIESDLEKLHSDVDELKEQRVKPAGTLQAIQVPPEKAAERRRDLEAKKRAENTLPG